MTIFPRKKLIFMENVDVFVNTTLTVVEDIKNRYAGLHTMLMILRADLLQRNYLPS